MPDYRLPDLSSFAWQPGVLSQLNDPPGSPSEGDRHLVGAAPTGVWIGHADQIAEWSGSAWEFTSPATGMVVWIEDVDVLRHYLTSWTTLPYDLAGAAGAVQGNLNTHAGNADAHHAQQHALVGSDHTASGLTAGHFLKALTPTTFGFAAHGLTYSDVGAAAVGHDHSGVYEPAGVSWTDVTDKPTTFAPTDHNLLSASHGDTTPAAVVRGDIITGQGATPKWARLAKGTSGYPLLAGGTDVAWGQLAAAGIADEAVTLAKMAHMATASLLGRATAAVGDVEVLTDIPTGITIGTKYIYRADGTDVPIADGGTGQSTKAAGYDALSPMTTLGDLVYGGASGTGTRLAGNTANSNYYLRSTAVGGVAQAPAWQAGLPWADVTGAPATYAPTDHNLLSASHGDTTPAAVVRGDIITGQGATPKWARLAKGGAGTYLKSDGTDVSWATLNQAAVAGLTTGDGPTFDHLHVTNNVACATLNVATFLVTVEAASLLNQDVTSDAGPTFDHAHFTNGAIIAAASKLSLDGLAAPHSYIMESEDGVVYFYAGAKLMLQLLGGITPVVYSGYDFQIAEAKNVVLGTTTGTKFGTATNQKQGWWNATPVVQPAHLADPAASSSALATWAAAINLRFETLGLCASA